MSLSHVLPNVLLEEDQTRSAPSGLVEDVPWTLWTVIAGITCALLGGTLDVSWHMSVGRESLWTLAHGLIEMEAVLVGLAALCTIIRATRGAGLGVKEYTVNIMGLRAPAGAFLCLWGCVGMLSSTPFDDWWHNAYGLDTKIVATPPHVLLLLGSMTDKIGAMAWIASLRNRSSPHADRTLSKFLLWIGTICVAQFTMMIIAQTWMTEMHTAVCYFAVGLLIPPMLLSTGWGSGFRWGCSLTALVYTVLSLAVEWGLPLIPAHPKLGPVYHNVTHFVPLRFPLLLLPPAYVCDVLLQVMAARSAWKKALFLGPAFVTTYLIVQWPFATFLLSPQSRNWIFGTAYFGYADTAGFLYDPYVFTPTEGTRTFVAIMVAAFAAAILSSRFGFAWGNWLRRICR